MVIDRLLFRKRTFFVMLGTHPIWSKVHIYVLKHSIYEIQLCKKASTMGLSNNMTITLTTDLYIRIDRKPDRGRSGLSIWKYQFSYDHWSQATCGRCHNSVGISGRPPYVTPRGSVMPGDMKTNNAWEDGFCLAIGHTNTEYGCRQIRRKSGRWVGSGFLSFQSCWPPRDHIERSTGISNPAWHLPQVVPRVFQTTGSVHPQPILPNC